MQQIADKVEYLKLDFTKYKAVYNACAIVLRSAAGLLPDVLAELQDCRKCSHATVV